MLLCFLEMVFTFFVSILSAQDPDAPLFWEGHLLKVFPRQPLFEFVSFFCLMISWMTTKFLSTLIMTEGIEFIIFER